MPKINYVTCLIKQAGNFTMSIKEILEECESYFENKADADGSSEGYVPNKEMELLVLIREALKELKS